MKRNLLLEYRVRKLEKLVLEKAIGKLPKYFYHGTLKKNKDSILKYGLTRGNKSDKFAHKTDSNYVYFCGSEHKAGIWASLMTGHGKDTKIYPIVIFRIDSSYLDPELIINDKNALYADDADLYSDSWDEETDDFTADALNPDFTDSGLDTINSDFQYAGDIPPEALSIVYESDDDLDTKIQDLLGISGKSDNVDFRAIFKDYDKYKDIKISDGSVLKTVPEILASKLQINGIPLSKIPVDILNTILPQRYTPYEPTVLSYQIAYDSSQSAQKLVDLAKTMASIRGLSDHNIELLFKHFLTKPKQTQVMDQIAELPTDFLMKAKPYIAKKYWSQLGI